MACALRLSQLIDKHNAKTSRLSAQQRKHLRVGKGPRDRASIAFPEHCSILAPCANSFPASRRKRPSTPQSQGGSLLSYEKGKVQVSHHSSATARSWQLRHLAESLCEVVGRQSRRSRRSRSSPDLPALSYCWTVPALAGVRTDDKGIDKERQRKSNFEPGYDLQAKVVILAEGSRGSLTKQLLTHFQLYPKTQSADLWPGHKRALGAARRTHRPW